MKVPFTLGVVGHFGLAVRNPKKSAKWFDRVLGLRKKFEFENGIAIGNDNVTIALFKGKPSPRTMEHMSFHLPNGSTTQTVIAWNSACKAGETKLLNPSRSLRHPNDDDV